ncbi:MAG: hypothetical protein I3273_04870 [Candidatus Moeniiplasma glomeromycotorum]|nr:hypothetical protein [Candidatus Moeniiplasma glomeromycotorum]
MTNLQQYLDQKYPTQSDKEKVKEIILSDNEKEIAGGKLDLSEYVNLEKLALHGNWLKSPLTKLKLGKMPNLKIFSCSYNQLTSVDFLSELTHPEKLKSLSIVRNNFQPTILDFLCRFTNLKALTLGTAKEKIEAGTYNRFYGSLEPLKNLHDLTLLCIAGTDVDSGLEYLSLPKSAEGERNIILDCQPLVPFAKVKAIKKQLKPFSYDIWAWQLANPKKVLVAQPKLFSQDRQKEEWEKELELKIKAIQEQINNASQVGTTPKTLARLESCLKLLKEAQAKGFPALPNDNSDKDQSNNNDKKLTELRIKVKDQIQTELKKHNLKTSDLSSEVADWESQLEKLITENEIKELQRKISAEIEKKSKSDQKEEKNDGFSLATKILLGGSIILVVLFLAVLIYFLAKKKKKNIS